MSRPPARRKAQASNTKSAGDFPPAADRPAGLGSAASPAGQFQKVDLSAMERSMKKFSIVGLILGALLGAVVALMAGGWLFWLGAGLAIGILIGSTQAR